MPKRRVLPWEKNKEPKAKVAAHSEEAAQNSAPMKETTRKRRTKDLEEQAIVESSKKFKTLRRSSSSKRKKIKIAAREESNSEKEETEDEAETKSPFFSAKPRARQATRGYPSSLSGEYDEQRIGNKDIEDEVEANEEPTSRWTRSKRDTQVQTYTPAVLGNKSSATITTRQLRGSRVRCRVHGDDHDEE
ncbi:hypothetical protein BDV96DRAFT_566283 [Lophiotrema nucula]|uniref:Uncharacterized protein n=1 Tax=Lophiotrema nucula TaxID=690887 RepID=A0A6A5ZM16_9PLEO|nr:hypothetical protein BDV96DRAFT_566283 [Lophiotrema nucula]